CRGLACRPMARRRGTRIEHKRGSLSLTSPRKQLTAPAHRPSLALVDAPVPHSLVLDRESSRHQSVPGEVRFFPATPYNATRSMVASAERISANPGPQQVAKRPSSAWQSAAWGYFETIGEVHFGLSLIGQ